MNSHPYLVSSANWQSRDLHSSPVIFLRVKSKNVYEEMMHGEIKIPVQVAFQRSLNIHFCV